MSESKSIRCVTFVCVLCFLFQRKYPVHYKIALIINYLGHCISVGALVVAFILFLCLRQVQK